MNKEFEDVLEKDEQIIWSEKPNKKRFYWSIFFSYLFSSFFAGMWVPLMFVGMAIEKEATWTSVWIALGAFLGFIVLAISISMLIGDAIYKKTFYAISNKRILIRTGFIGVDYKMMELKLMGATSVKVGLLDKILKQDTGIVRFGSPSAQMMGANGVSSTYRFAGVTKPYEVSKLVRKAVEEAK